MSEGQNNHQPLEGLFSPIHPTFLQYANNYHFHFTEEATETQKYQVFNLWIKNRFEKWKQNVSERLEPRHAVSPFCTRSPVSSSEHGRPSFPQHPTHTVQVYIHTNSITRSQLPGPETELLHNFRGHHSFKLKGNRVLWVVQGCVFGIFLWGRVGCLFSPKWSVPILTPNSQSSKRVKQNIHTLLKNRALHIWNPASLSIDSWQVLSPPQISISSSVNEIITIVPKSCVIVKIKWDHKVSSIVSGTCGLNKYH